MKSKDNTKMQKSLTTSNDVEEFVTLFKRMPHEEKLKLYYIAQGIVLVLDKAIVTQP